MDSGVIDSLLQPGHLVLAIEVVSVLGLAGYFAFPFLHRKAMLNGSGKIFRMIIAEENAKQTEHNEEKFRKLLKETIEAHEKVEEQKLKLALLEHQQKEQEKRDAWEG